MTPFETLQKLFQLKASLSRLREQLADITAQIPELTFRQREAQEKVWAVSGSFRKLLNRLSGKGQEELEEAEQALLFASAELEGARRKKDSLKSTIDQLESEIHTLGRKEDLLAKLTDPEREHILRLEASLHAQQALLFLNKCQKELEQAQYYARNPMMQMNDQFQEDTHKANAGALADQCRQQLEAIIACGFDISIHPYLQNPMGYIVTARRYGDQDQMNLAQKGLRETEKLLKELLLQSSK